jgi:hypothetical protein
MKRVEAASGAKYSVHRETARKAEPIAPVGSSYKPVGRPDIATMRTAAPAAPPKSAPAPGTANPPRSAASFLGKPAAAAGRVQAPADSWDNEPSAPTTKATPASVPPPTQNPVPAPPPASSRPVPNAPRSTPAVNHKLLLASNQSDSISGSSTRVVLECADQTHRGR